jgi:hypothetical protein
MQDGKHGAQPDSIRAGMGGGMMSKSDIMRDFVLPHVGHPYIFAASGQKCTPEYRQQQMKSKPAYAAKIKAYCPVLSGKQATCAGCKYEDDPAYDCSGLTMRAAKAVGVSMPHGASSQWNGDYWSDKGPISTLPKDKNCFLFERAASASPMGHVGFKVSETEAVEARGHAYGVVKTKIKDRPWTDWAILKDAPPFTEEEKQLQDQIELANMPTLKKGSKGEYVKRMQNLLIAKGFTLPMFGADGDFGKETLQALKDFQTAISLTVDGICGPSTWSELLEDGPEDTLDPEPDEPIKNPYTFTVTLTAEQAKAEFDRLCAAYGACEMAVG